MARTARRTIRSGDAGRWALAHTHERRERLSLGGRKDGHGEMRRSQQPRPSRPSPKTPAAPRTPADERPARALAPASEYDTWASAMPIVDSIYDRGQFFLPLSLTGSAPHYFIVDT